MGSRYLVTGVQVGMLIGLIQCDQDVKAVEELNKILDTQCVGTSESEIGSDVEKISEYFE